MFYYCVWFLFSNHQTLPHINHLNNRFWSYFCQRNKKFCQSNDWDMMQWILLRQEVKWQNKSRNGQNYISPDTTLQKMHLCAFLAWVAHFHISGHPSMNLRVENDLLIEEDPQDLREQWSILKNFILKIATTLTVKFISVSVLSTTFSLIWVLSTLVLSINFLTKLKPKYQVCVKVCVINHFIYQRGHSTTTWTKF